MALDWPAKLKQIAMDKRAQVAAGVVAVLLLLAALLPMLVDADRFVPQIETQLSTALGRKVTVGQLSLNLFRGGLVADNLAIADDPAYSSAPFLQAKSLVVGVELMPLLLHKELNVKKFEVVQPSMQIIENAAGKWNFSTIGNSSAATVGQTSGATTTPTLTVDKLEIDNAQLTVQSPRAPTAHVYNKVNLTVEKFSFTSAFPFTLTATLPGDGKVKLSGTAGPVDATDNTLTPVTADLTVTHLEPVGAGFVSSGGGMDGVLDVTAHLASDGKTAQLDGRVTGNKMRFVAKGTPASTPVTVDFSTTYDLASQTGVVTKGAVAAGNVKATVGGTYLLKPTGTELHLQLNAPGMSVDGLQTLLPAAGVTLPNGSGLKGGTLSAALKIDGPVTNLTIAGPVDLDNTRLEGFSLASKLGSLPLMNKLGGADGNGTEIQSLHADIVMTPAQLETNNVAAVVPALGKATGDGVVLPGGELNYKMQVSLTALNGLGSLTRGLSSLLGGKGNTASGNDGGGIPLLIKGTTADPSFRLDTSALGFGKPSGGSSTAPGNSPSNSTAKTLKGLFGR